jgi:hypothetical protein
MSLSFNDIMLQKLENLDLKTDIINEMINKKD